MPPRSLALCFVLLLCACPQDPGIEALRVAKQQYAALIDSGKTAEQPAFDALLAQLQAIDNSSKAAADARSLQQSITRARASKVPAPLAVANVQLPQTEPALATTRAQLQATLAECAELAQALAVLTGPSRQSHLQRIADCRQRAHHLDDALALGHCLDGGADAP